MEFRTKEGNYVSQKDQRGVWRKCQKFILRSQCGKDGMNCPVPVIGGFWHLSLYLTALCSGSSGAPPTPLVALPWEQLSQIRLTGHPEPGNVGAAAQLPELNLGPLSLGVGGGGGWVGRGTGRGLDRDVVREEKEV